MLACSFSTEFCFYILQKMLKIIAHLDLFVVSDTVVQFQNSSKILLSLEFKFFVKYFGFVLPKSFFFYTDTK